MSTRALSTGCVVIILLLVVPAFGLFGWMAFGGGTSKSEQWPDYFDLDLLVSESDLIILAEFSGEERRTVYYEAAGFAATREELLRTYLVFETFKGPELNDLVAVHWPIANLGSKSGPSHLESNETYVLFLKQFSQDGEPVWSHVGDPGIARFDENHLVFLASRRYLNEVKEQGMIFPVAGSDAPFRATLDDLRELDSPEQVDP